MTNKSALGLGLIITAVYMEISGGRIYRCDAAGWSYS